MERVLNSLFNGVTWSVYAAFAFGVAQKVIVCILVFFIGKRLIRWLLKLCDRIFERTKIDLSVAGFLRHAIRIVLYVLLALVLVDYLGFETSSA